MITRLGMGDRKGETGRDRGPRLTDLYSSSLKGAVIKRERAGRRELRPEGIAAYLDGVHGEQQSDICCAGR